MLSILEQYDPQFKSAVAIVQNGDRWLLGLATNTGDGRSNKWVHPGGHIKKGETPEEAAVRECWEETGIKVKSVSKAFTMNGYKDIAFVHCKVTKRNQEFEMNEEFSAMGFFMFKELRSLKLFSNVKKLIERVR